MVAVKARNILSAPNIDIFSVFPAFGGNNRVNIMHGNANIITSRMIIPKYSFSLVRRDVSIAREIRMSISIADASKGKYI